MEGKVIQSELETLCLLPQSLSSEGAGDLNSFPCFQNLAWHGQQGLGT